MDGHKEVREFLKSHAVWDLWKSMPDGQEKYRAYLCSPDWGKLRAAVEQRSGGTCERCKFNPAAAVHHLTYQRKYAERLEDLAHECQGCHDYTHGRSTVDPRDEYFKLVPARPLQDSLAPTDQWGHQESAVCCPLCGDNYSHIQAVKQNTRDSNQGDVTISMWGECGHTWDIVFHGHKGNCFAITENLGSDNDAGH